MPTPPTSNPAAKRRISKLAEALVETLGRHHTLRLERAFAC